MTVVWVAGHALRDNPHAPRYKSSRRSRDSRPYDENRCIESVLTVASTDLGERIIRCAAKGATARENSIRPVHRMPGRSEEHTSELQSLMRISYAVFCLKNQTENNTDNIDHAPFHCQ